MKKIFSFLLLGATILCFSACEKEKPVSNTTGEKSKWQVSLVTTDLQGATATLSKTTDVTSADEVILKITPNENFVWQTPPTASATNASLKNKTTEGNMYNFVFTNFESNSVITVTGLAAEEATNSENGHEYVDLGLPSGILWATCNVGASHPGGYGKHFAWGETEPKNTYNWSTYKHGSAYNQLTKYCTSSNYGTVDNKSVLELEDDAARANWGGKWRMPNIEEQKELLDNCIWTWTTLKGVPGYEVKGQNGKSIFLPAAGYFSDSSFTEDRDYGHYWLSELASEYPNYAYFLYFDSADHHYCNNFSRYHGRTVRAVCKK